MRAAAPWTAGGGLPAASGDSAAVPEAAWSVPERELKYRVPPGREVAVAALLGQLCRADAEHPDGVVRSVYFDTTDLASLVEKRSSDYLKTKLRVRWYEPRATRGGVFVEVKRRVGALRLKTRLAVELGADAGDLSLASPALLELPRRLRDHGVPVPEGLLPTVEVAYRRRRWVEPASGARVCLDTGVRLARANPALCPSPVAWPLGASVVEVKGGGDDLPRRLRPLLALGCRWGGFSKYAECCRLGGA